MKLSSDFSDLLSALSDANARFLVVGGHAVIHHTEPRFTKDLDLWIDPTLENATAVWRALASFGAPLNGVTPEDFASKTLIYQIGQPPVRIDILGTIDGVPDFGPAWGRRSTATIEGVEVPFMGLADLLAAKTAVMGQRRIATDKADVAKLRRKVTTAKMERLPVAVSGAPPGEGYDYAFAHGLHKMAVSPTAWQEALRDALRSLRQPPYDLDLGDEPLGCGFYACAYSVRDSKWIIKITGDLTEAAAWQRLLNDGGIPKGLAPTRLVFAFPEIPGGDGRRLYGIVQERLTPLPEAEHQFVYEFGPEGLIVEAAEEPVNEKSLIAAAESYWANDDVQQSGGVHTWPAEGPVTGTKAPDGIAHLRAFLRNLRKFNKRGVRTEDIHGDNVMACHDGSWCIVDLGVSEGRETTVPELSDVNLREALLE